MVNLPEKQRSLADTLLDQKQIDRWFEETGRPFVTLSWAQSLDGSLTLTHGKSSPVSCRDSLTLTHQLRTRHDGILIGIETALADNPSLTARLPLTDTYPQPRPIVLDSQLRIPADLRLFSHAIRPIIATTVQAKKASTKQLAADLLCTPAAADGRVSLSHLLSGLGQMGIRSVMVEGGGRVITSFLSADIANRAIITVAPVFVGGYDAVHPLGEKSWSQLPRLENMQTVSCGSDLIVAGDFRRVTTQLASDRL